jgi:hypothetical protein
VTCPPQSPLLPNHGQVTGGNTVDITGSGFIGATGVSFGGVPATRFTVKADDVIEAVAPPGTGTVPVSVNHGATAEVVDRYAYGADAPESTVGPSEPEAVVSSFVRSRTSEFTPVLNDLKPAIDDSIRASNATCLAAHGALVLATAAFAVTLIPVALETRVALQALRFTQLVVKNYGASGVFTNLVADWWAESMIHTALTEVSKRAVDAYFGACPNSSLLANIRALIDPSGAVLDRNGNPVSGATATILRSDSAAGPFAPVAAASAGISPAVNPETTGLDGVFHWDVASGFYEVQASAPGCTDPNPPSSPTATIGPYPVPPPQLGLTITLACANEPPPPVPTVTSLSAQTGPAAGETAATILGSGFTPSSTVTFGQTSATVTFLSPEALMVVSPPGVGLVHVVVHNQDASSATSTTDQFFYGSRPTVSALNVDSGPASGGTSVTVSGTGFIGATDVAFGGLPASSFAVLSDTEIKATTPAEPAGVAHVLVLTPAGGNAETSADQFTFVPVAQTIIFVSSPPANPLVGGTYSLAAKASSGLPVFFSATGSCTISAATVYLTGVGSCTITASQPGNASYSAAPAVSQTFSIAKTGQTIAFGSLANKTYGDPDFAVSASASSGLAVAFAASGNCTISASTVHLTSPGSCTITASQPGNASYSAAPAVSQTFSIASRLTPPARCRVPNVVGKRFAAAKLAIKRSHCRTGKVGYSYSRKRRKGIVISESRRPGRVLPANSKINLVVSRGRRR